MKLRIIETKPVKRSRKKSDMPCISYAPLNPPKKYIVHNGTIKEDPKAIRQRAIEFFNKILELIK